MTQFYSNPKREGDPFALPNCEVFEYTQADSEVRFVMYGDEGDDNPFGAPGWYWWACFPGCLPDSDPIGPFDTEAEAIDDAQADAWQDDDADDDDAPEDDAPRLRCDQCNLSRITLGLTSAIVHEKGCPNDGATWEDGQWVRYRDCFTCGYPIREGEECGCGTREVLAWDDPEAFDDGF